MKTHQNTRKHYLLYLQTLRAALDVDPKTSPARVSRLAQVGDSVASELIKIGVLKELPEGGGLSFVGNKSDDDIFDELILARRAQSPKTNDDFKNLKALVDKHLQFNITRAEKIESKVETIEQNWSLFCDGLLAPAWMKTRKTELSKDDKELLELAFNDCQNNTARITQLERQVGDLMRELDRMRNAGAAPAPTLAPAEPVVAIPAAPAPVRKWRIGIVGVFERDLRHIQDGLNGHAKDVEVLRIDHVSRHRSIPSKLDCIITTPGGAHCSKEIARTCSVEIHQATGGNASICEKISQVIARK